MSQAKTTDSPTRLVNGLDLDALEQSIAAIDADPKEGRMAFNVVTRWAGKTRSESRPTAITLGGQRLERDFEIAADEPSELGGENSAANPQELLMSALNACMLASYVVAATRAGVELTKLEIETRGELDLRGFLDLDPRVKPGYDHIDYEVRIAADASPEQIQAVHEMVLRTSPNRFNLAMPVTLDSTLVIE
ncbi:MAG: OsmC family protein [Planctomycetota bacterium]